MQINVPPPDRLSAIADLLKAILWPMLALVAFLVWREPITEVIQTVPGMVHNSKEFTLGPLTIKGDVSTLPQPPADVANALRKLDGDKFRLLIQTGENSQMFNSRQQQSPEHAHEIATAHALEKVGLVYFQRSNDKDYPQQYGLTKLGVKTYSYLVDSLSKLVVTPTK